MHKNRHYLVPINCEILRLDLWVPIVYHNLTRSHKQPNKTTTRRTNTMTITTIYQNKRNENKFIEIHNDGHYHNSVRQFLQWSNGVKNFTGDRFLHRWRKADLNELLTDYTLVQAAE